MTHHNSPVLTQVIGCKCKLLSCDAPLTHKVQVLTPFLYLTLYSFRDAPLTNQHNQWHHLQYLCIRLWVLVLIIQKASCCFVLKSELWPSTCLRTYLASKIGHCQLTWPNHQWQRFQFGGIEDENTPNEPDTPDSPPACLPEQVPVPTIPQMTVSMNTAPDIPVFFEDLEIPGINGATAQESVPKLVRLLNMLESVCMRIRVTERETNKGSLWKEGRRGATKCEQCEE